MPVAIDVRISGTVAALIIKKAPWNDFYWERRGKGEGASYTAIMAFDTAVEFANDLLQIKNTWTHKDAEKILKKVADERAKD